MYLKKYNQKVVYSMKFIDINEFVSKSITKRKVSMFVEDIIRDNEMIEERINGKKFLVIGGAGSIGSSFIHAILAYYPEALVVVDINENSLAELTRDLRSSGDKIHIPDDYVTYPMDYASNVFAKMFRDRKGFDYVANFSAHKHVRSEKDIYSIESLLKNNIIHAKALLNLLTEFPPEMYFCVSTDKAANPVNIMGASKRIMEDMIFSYSDIFPVTTARFANVAFSNGSLPAGFLARLSKHQPLSAPSDVKRYFISLKESGQICMLACLLGKNREIFFPKLYKSQMMSFDKIATELLHAYGYEVLECSSEQEAIANVERLQSGSNKYPVYYSVSDTSGEKDYEEFFTDNEDVDLERMKALGIIIGKKVPDKVKIKLLCSRLQEEFDKECSDKEAIIKILHDYLPNFHHIELNKNLDSKM
jgi:FlaA1/EpsC-like NDP-sugar epimerase